MDAMIRTGLQPSPSGARRVVVKEASQPHANRLKAGFAPARADPTVKLSGKPGQFRPGAGGSPAQDRLGSDGRPARDHDGKVCHVAVTTQSTSRTNEAPASQSCAVYVAPGAHQALELGVDPGVTGAFALVDIASLKIIDVLDMPVVILGGKKWVDGHAFASWAVPYLQSITGAVVEQPGARQMVESESGKAIRRPGNEAILAASVGGVITALTMLRIPIRKLIRPVDWKRRAGLIKAEKKASLETARATFAPSKFFTLVKHSGRAEAALIALHGQDKRR